MMFTERRRAQVRDILVAKARADERINGAAITGSDAHDAADRWSDIDLFFGLAGRANVQETLNDWSEFAYRELGAIHHFDLAANAAVYRAFLLDDQLEIDLGFAPGCAFGPIGCGAFRVIFGEPVARKLRSFDIGHQAGLCWHHVLHARIAIERGRPWHAEYWISSLRDNTLTVASHRLGLPEAYAKGAHELPAGITDAAREALVRGLDTAELSRALGVATRAALRELANNDAELADTLRKPLLELAEAPLN